MLCSYNIIQGQTEYNAHDMNYMTWFTAKWYFTEYDYTFCDMSSTKTVLFIHEFRGV